MTRSPFAAEDALAARLVARMLIEVEAVHFRPDPPFIFTSGSASPVYIDCRKLISYPRLRSALMAMAVEKLQRHVGFEAFDAIAGGETAGIPFAAWIADRMALPMLYVRKKAKGFGRNAQIEGHVEPGARVLLVEDLASEGTSKIRFCEALRAAETRIEHVFVVFHYGIYPQSVQVMTDIGVQLHALATWWDVLEAAKAGNYFPPEVIAEVEAYLHEPVAWSATHGGKVEA